MAESIYRVELFRRRGFERKKCEGCGRTFWTLDPERRRCGDTPCVEYGFIGNPPTKRRRTLQEMERLFLGFFGKRSHSVIKRYPVVARWRDDIFLTIASIANFQPWVTGGLAPPPANPLVVSQPSIRLKDIDNVGRSGKHFTLFFMGGHHAFNTRSERIYWNDETVSLCHGFLTRGLGIDEDEITYVQDFWEGGGNAGEDFEVNVRGLEVATLVFMRYAIGNGTRTPLPLKIVDTGYGLERLSWITQGTPSCYEAIFPKEVRMIMDMAGIERPPAHVLAENSKLAGVMDVGSGRDLRMLRERVAEKTGMTVDELERMLAPVEAVYAVADHLRCLAFMFGDGVTPSNVREGYLARSVLRRALWQMRVLGLKKPLSELMEFELERLAESFPEFREKREHIIEVVDSEERKYVDAVSRGTRMVERIAVEARSRGGGIPVEKLVELYDSQGLTPDIVKEVAERMGVGVEVPEDFYSMVTKSQSRPRHVAGSVKEIPQDRIKGLRPTRLIFYDSPKTSEFRARVVRTFDDYVVLDRTAFYPEGGGQPSDTGFLVADGFKTRVVEAVRSGDIVLHRVEQNRFRKGQIVRGFLDWEKRRSLMMHHTATHILLGAARRVLGPHIWQQGVQKGVDRTRLDISHFRRVSDDELRRIERLSNQVVIENRQVRTAWMGRNEAEKRYGFDLYQGGVVPGRMIRVVEVDGWNTQACAGTHCESTGEVGLIKVIRTERIQDGIERIEFASGLSALDIVSGWERELKKAAEALRTSPDGVSSAVGELFGQWKESQKKIEAFRERMAGWLSEVLIGRAIMVGDFRVVCEVVEGAGPEELIKLCSALTDDKDDVVALLASAEGGRANLAAMAGAAAVRAGVNCGSIISEISRIVGGGGGGRDNMAQGGGPEANMLKAAVDKAFELIRRSLQG
ncbi:MAG: alanine--tRNA ligase [Candidatus Hadarchaeales archaeon]